MRVSDRWFWGLWGAWTLAHVVWYSKAPENYEWIWGGMYRMRAPMIFLWTCVGVPIFITGLVLWVVRGWRNYRAARPLGDSPDADRWWWNPPF